jgi:hypothetical protein
MTILSYARVSRSISSPYRQLAFMRRLSREAADSDEAGHAFQCEAGHLFRSEAGRGSDLMSATVRRASAGRWDDVFLCWLGQVDGSSIRRLRMLSPASSIR